MNKQPIEEIFRQALRHYKASPPAEVWMQVKKNIHARRRRRIVFGISIPLLISLICAGVVWVTQWEKLIINQNTNSQNVNSAILHKSDLPKSPGNTHAAARNPSTQTIISEIPHNSSKLVKTKSFNSKTSAFLKSKYSTQGNVNKMELSEGDHLPVNDNGLLTEYLFKKDTQDALPTIMSADEPSPARKDSEEMVVIQEISDIAENSHTENTASCIKPPIYLGLAYEAGSMWRINPKIAPAGVWLPVHQTEILSNSKNGNTSFNDVYQNIQLLLGYRFGKNVFIQANLGHLRISHFESGNLLNRSLPSEGQLGLMTSTGGIRLGAESADNGTVVINRLNQHFSFFTISPSLTYNMIRKNWVIGFSGGLQLNLLYQNRAEIRFGHGTHKYKHDGLNTFSLMVYSGASVGYQLNKFLISVGFNGSYWPTSLARSEFSSTQFLGLGVRPSIIYFF